MKYDKVFFVAKNDKNCARTRIVADRVGVDRARNRTARENLGLHRVLALFEEPGREIFREKERGQTYMMINEKHDTGGEGVHTVQRDMGHNELRTKNAEKGKQCFLQSA